METASRTDRKVFRDTIENKKTRSSTKLPSSEVQTSNSVIDARDHGSDPSTEIRQVLLQAVCRVLTKSSSTNCKNVSTPLTGHSPSASQSKTAIGKALLDACKMGGATRNRVNSPNSLTGIRAIPAAAAANDAMVNCLLFEDLPATADEPILVEEKEREPTNVGKPVTQVSSLLSQVSISEEVGEDCSPKTPESPSKQGDVMYFEGTFSRQPGSTVRTYLQKGKMASRLRSMRLRRAVCDGSCVVLCDVCGVAMKSKDLLPHRSQCADFQAGSDDHSLTCPSCRKPTTESHVSLVGNRPAAGPYLIDLTENDRKEPKSAQPAAVSARAKDCPNSDETVTVVCRVDQPKETPLSSSADSVGGSAEIDMESATPSQADDADGVWTWRHGNVVLRCTVCGTLLRSRREVSRHHLVQHIEAEQPENVKCSYCRARFRNIFEYEQHVRRVHRNASPTHPLLPPFRCKICGQSFLDEQARNWHLLKHDGPKPLSCRLCEDTFALGPSLKDHMLKQHPDEPLFPCDFPGCGQSFPCCCDLHAHSRAHAEPYSCPRCPVYHEDRLRYEDHLAAHMDLASLSRVRQLKVLISDAVLLSAVCDMVESVGDTTNTERRNHNSEVLLSD